MTSPTWNVEMGAGRAGTASVQFESGLVHQHRETLGVGAVVNIHPKVWINGIEYLDSTRASDTDMYHAH